MILLDDQPVFTGPTALRPAGRGRRLEPRTFGGLDGELLVDLGAGPESLHQTGRLQADTTAALREQIELAESFLDGAPHTLTDPHGGIYAGCVMESFELTTPVRRGRGFWCEYEARYRRTP